MTNNAFCLWCLDPWPDELMNSDCCVLASYWLAKGERARPLGHPACRDKTTRDWLDVYIKTDLGNRQLAQLFGFSLGSRNRRPPTDDAANSFLSPHRSSSSSSSALGLFFFDLSSVRSQLELCVRCSLHTTTISLPACLVLIFSCCCCFL